MFQLLKTAELGMELSVKVLRELTWMRHGKKLNVDKFMN